MTHNHQTAKFLVETKGIAIKHRGAVFTAARTSSTQALYCKKPKTVSTNIRCAKHTKRGLDKASWTKLSKRSRACALHNIFLFVIRWHRSQNIVMQAVFRCKKCHIFPVKNCVFWRKERYIYGSCAQCTQLLHKGTKQQTKEVWTTLHKNWLKLKPIIEQMATQQKVPWRWNRSTRRMCA